MKWQHYWGWLFFIHHSLNVCIQLIISSLLPPSHYGDVIISHLWQLQMWQKGYCLGKCVQRILQPFLNRPHLFNHSFYQSLLTWLSGNATQPLPDLLFMHLHTLPLFTRGHQPSSTSTFSSVKKAPEAQDNTILKRRKHKIKSLTTWFIKLKWQ